MAMTVGTLFSVIDGCHFKHIIFRDGVAHMCTTIDGNNKALLLATAICETESNDTWSWFGSECKKIVLFNYFKLPKSVIMHDRMKGIDKFLEYFPAVSLECYHHIISNIYKHAGGRKNISLKLLWDLRNASTFDEWFQIFKGISRVSLSACDYIKDCIEDRKVWRWSHLENGIVTHGRRTSQVQEVVCYIHYIH